MMFFHRSMRGPGRGLAGALLFACALALGSAPVYADGASVWSIKGKRNTVYLAGSVHACAGARRVAALESPPLGELVRVALEPSQNWVAEQLTFALGDTLGERGSLAQGLDIVERFLIDDVGLDPLDVAARDGSGLSAYNLVTPRAIARVLRFMRAPPIWCQRGLNPRWLTKRNRFS